MQKIFLLAGLLLIAFLSSCTLGEKKESLSETEYNTENLTIQDNLSPEKIKEQQTQESIQNKIETIRKRLALKGLIIDGDSYYRDGQIALALVKYLEFYRKNPEDQVILEKLGDTYFSLNKYTSSYSYYSKILEPTDNILDKIGLSLLHKTDFSDVASVKASQTTLKNTFPQGELRDYYDISLSCVLDFHTCKLEMGEYFWPEESENTEVVTQPEIEFSKLQNLKTAIENYRNFQVDEVYLKDAYIVASWYSNELYSLSAHMGEKILGYKPGYKPVLKIVSQSYFKLGEYENSRVMLSKYQDIDDEDSAVNYMLGLVHTQLKDYVLANIHLSKAIKLGSPESLEIRRQLIHNFYQLDNQSNILNEFQNLVENESEYTPDDLGLGIYNHILEGDYETALSWAKLGKEKFSEDAGNFYAYQAWILRDKGDVELADSILKVGYEKFPDNPFILINLGYTALELNSKGAAVSYFKTILKDYPDTEFAISAQKEIDILSKS